MLSTYLPEVTSQITLPDLSAVIQFFMRQSSNFNQTDEENQTTDGLLDKKPTKDFLSNVKEYVKLALVHFRNTTTNLFSFLAVLNPKLIPKNLNRLVKVR